MSSVSFGVGLATGLTLLLVVLIVTAAVTFLQPNVFSSSARIRAKAGEDGLITGRIQPAHKPNKHFPHTEVDVIQSEPVLGAVVQNLGLDKSWGRKYGIGKLTTQESILLLRKHIDVFVLRKTDGMEIRA